MTLLPPNATSSELALEQTIARISDVPIPIGDLWNPLACPSAQLSWLAWSLSVDEWDSSWPDDIKRQTIAASLELHQRKGTPWAVQRALDRTGFPQAKIKEWFEYNGNPGYFKVIIDVLNEGIDAATWDKLEARINKYKNKRSWLQDLELWLSGVSTSNYGLTCNGGELLTVWPYRTTVIEQAFPGYHGLGLQAVETVIVYPQI